MIEVQVYKGAGDKEAPPISDPLIITESMATIRGRRALEDPTILGYFQTFERTLRVPHHEDVIPGAWIRVTDSKLGLSRQAVKVVSVSTSIEPAAVFDEIVVHQYVDPEA